MSLQKYATCGTGVLTEGSNLWDRFSYRSKQYMGQVSLQNEVTHGTGVLTDVGNTWDRYLNVRKLIHPTGVLTEVRGTEVSSTWDRCLYRSVQHMGQVSF